MELVIEHYDALPCELETFTINGKRPVVLILVILLTMKKEKKTLMAVVICTLSQSLQQR